MKAQTGSAGIALLFNLGARWVRDPVATVQEAG